MARRFTNRRELEEHDFHPVVLVAVVICALFLQVYLPRLWSPLEILDLPLIVVLYLSISWRNPMAGTLVGTAVGLLQDLPNNQYIGVNGMAKAIIGYASASIGLKVDVDNLVTRLGMNFGFCLLQSLILFIIQRFLLGESGYAMQGLHELLRAIVNAVIAVPIFFLLDRTRVDEGF
jgi:rod shape-determining protein MreD